MKTIGICAYNEEKSIPKTLRSLLPQINPEDEVIVEASGSTDKTKEVVEAFLDSRIRVIEGEKRGKVGAINTILKEAKGEIIIFCDADVIVEKGALNKLLGHFQDKKVGAISGRMLSYKKENLFDKLQDLGFEGLNDQKIKENKKGNFWALNGYLVAVRKGVVDKIEEKWLLDDCVLGWKIKEAGYKVIYDPEAIVYVKAAQNLKDFIKQKLRNRIGWWQLTKVGMKLRERRNLSQLKFLFKNPYTWIYIPLDLFIWLKAYFYFKTNRMYWERVTSSKI
jgi:cellulose synthase/poly-beta-1,6-N-acetylglucosamine synthase-like glycosyltransferase